MSDWNIHGKQRLSTFATPTPSSTVHDLDLDMNVVASAVLSGLLYFTRGPCPGRGCPVGKKCEVIISSWIPSLPPELYSVIASHLSHNQDQRTLASCALVSSAWRSASRPFLFHTITLTHTNIRPFLDLFHNPLCSFKNAVKVVKIREGEFLVDRWLDQFLPRLIASLNDDDDDGSSSTTRVLDIYNLTWAELSPRSVKALQQGFRGIQSLRVGTCYWECVHEFADLVCSSSFDGLKHLVCDYVLLNCSTPESCECSYGEEEGVGVSVGDDEGEEQLSRRNAAFSLYSSPTSLPLPSRIRHRNPPARLPQTLESLYLSFPEESMLQWFTTQDIAIRGLRKLGISVRDSTVIEVVEELVLKTGASLEELVLDLPLGSAISLARNTSLQILRLRIPSLFSFCDRTSQGFSSTTSTFSNSYHHYNYTIQTIQTIHTLLSSLSSPSLHTLVFDIDAMSIVHPRTSTTNNYSRLYDYASVILSNLSTSTTTTTVNPPPRSLSLVFAVRYSGTAKIFERARRAIHSFVQVLREESLSSVDCLRWDVSVEGVRVGNSSSNYNRSGYGGGGRDDDDDDDDDGEEGKDEDVVVGGEEEEEDEWRREGAGEAWKSWITD